MPEIPIFDSSDFTAAKRDPEPKPPVQLVEAPTPLPLPGQLKPVAKAERKKDDTAPKDRVVGANAAARLEPVKEGYINAIQVYPYTKGALNQLYAAVNQVTDIALEPGEKLVSVSAGDTVRWVVGDTSSGQGKYAIVHILVKPIGADLETNLVITTDRRTYQPGNAFQRQDLHGVGVVDLSAATELISLRKQRAEAEAAATAVADTGVNIDQLRFRYRIEGDAPWKPRQVFDDGAKVYIQFPSGLAQSEAPPLFVIGRDGKPAMVNYRVRGTTYIVDRLFAAAELRLGTAPQRVVRIVRTDAVWRESRQRPTAIPVKSHRPRASRRSSSCGLGHSRSRVSTARC